MSKCIIQVKIGDQIITLDPNADINADDSTPVVRSIDVNKLKLLFNNLKGSVQLDKVLSRNLNVQLVAKGEGLYNDAVENEFITPLGAVLREKDQEKRKALMEYVNSLDTKEVLKSGNFLISAKDAYKLSPYTHSDIRRLLFKSSSNSAYLFNQFMNMPGMESVRISIAFMDDYQDAPLTMVKGAYIAPDNIIQILVPTNYQIKGRSGDKLQSTNFKGPRIQEISRVLLHELTHAVFSELYIGDVTFKNKMNVIHDDFIKRAKDKVLVGQYENIHEFISDIFINKKLQQAMSAIPALTDQVREGEFKTLYTFFTATLSKAMSANESLLKDMVGTLAASIPTGELTTTFQNDQVDVANNPDFRQTIFFTPGDIEQADINEHISPNDYTTTYGGINGQAFAIQAAFLKRHDVSKNEWTIRDAYYKATKNAPSTAEIDRLQKEDLVSIPWLRYIRVDKESGTTGRWQEQGVLVDKKGKEIRKDGKVQVVDLIRVNGEIVQDEKANGGIISPRTKLVPVVYANSKKGKVIVAKVGVKDSDGFNTVSIPYSLINGYRKFDRTYFNHNEDFAGQLNDLMSERSKVEKTNQGEITSDALFALDQRITYIKEQIKKADIRKEEMIDHAKKMAFSYKEDDTTYMNVSEADFKASGWGKESTTREFAPADKALYIINKDKDNKYRMRPNPSIFRTLWEDEIGKHFVKSSEGISQAVTRGDMIRVGMKINIDVTGKDGKVETQNIERDTWLPVFARLANGIEVATTGGTGMIIPFNKIDTYAKNITSEEFTDLALKVRDLKNAFEEDLYIEPTDASGRRKLNKEFISSNVQFKSLQYNEKYNNKNADTEEEARARFGKGLSKTLALIKPYESFVKVTRKFLSKGSGSDKGAIVNYQTNDLVLAATDEGLLVMGEKSGKYNFEYIRFDEQIDKHDNYGRELSFLMQDISAVSRVWEEFAAEKKQYEKLKDVPQFVNEGTKTSPKWVKSDSEARNVRDSYDLYDEVDGTKISRLQQGDIVAIKMLADPNNPKLPQYYYRKVVTVHDNGSVTVAEFAKEDKKFDSGFVIKAGVYPKTITSDKIAKVGYRLGVLTGDKDNGYIAEFHNDVLQRRQKLQEYAQKDLDFDDFLFAPAGRAQKFNNSSKFTSGHNKRYVPLTNKILSPKSDEDLVYLNKRMEPVAEKDAIWIQAWFNGDSFKNALRGINANTTFLKVADITTKKGVYTNMKPDILAQIMPGDWVVSEYRDKAGKIKQFSSLIERIEGGQIYTLASNFETYKVNLNKIIGIRTSLRNDKFSGFKRTNDLLKLIKEDKASSEKSQPKQSMDTDYKSPKDSRRVLFEFGNRFQQLNPDVKLNYVEQADVNDLFNSMGYDYTNTRAFILNGEVNINLDRASVSDVVHEYAHLFLHSLKYESPEMYAAIISTATSHPLYTKVARDYAHLTSQEDLDEEVFVTILGEYLADSLKERDKDWITERKEVFDNFSEFTKTKLEQLLGKPVDSLYDLEAGEVLGMRLEDVINLVGDEIIKNRIYDIYNQPTMEFNRDLKRLKMDLRKLGLLTEECYG